MGQPVIHHDVFLVFLITEKLPAETRTFWELSTPGTETQTYEDLKKTPLFTTRQNSQPSQSSQRSYNVNVATSEVKCDCCKGFHKLHLCPKFKDLTVLDRAEFVKLKKLCFICLRAGHRQQDCRGTTCRQCNLKHHILLHMQSSRPTRSVNNTVEDNN